MTEEIVEVDKEKMYDEAMSVEVVETESAEMTALHDNMRTEAAGWAKTAEAAYVNLARCLHSIREDQLYVKWGFSSFREYTEIELNTSVRKAEYLVQVWEYYFIRAGEGRSELIEKVQHLGFTKLKDCIDVLTKDNADELIPKLEKLSVRKVSDLKKQIVSQQMQQSIAHDQSESGLVEEAEISEAPSVASSVNFKMYPDQQKSLEDALKKAGEIGNTTCRNQQLNYIACEFLNTYTSAKGEQAKAEIFSRFEEQHGIKMLVVDAATRNVVWGENLPDEL